MTIGARTARDRDFAVAHPRFVRVSCRVDGAGVIAVEWLEPDGRSARAVACPSLAWATAAICLRLDDAALRSSGRALDFTDEAAS